MDALRGVREELRAAAQQPPQQLPATPAATPAATAAASTSQPPVLEAPPLTGDADTSTAASTSYASEPAAAASAASATSAASAASTSSSSGPDLPPARPLDPVGLELLTAKSFAAWRGHEQDALATYEELIKAFPEVGLQPGGRGPLGGEGGGLGGGGRV